MDATARHVVGDLHSPRPLIFWLDLLTCAALGWGGFVLALQPSVSASARVAAAIVSTLALYRGLCFTHELTHLRRRVLPGFETVWNILFGVPLLLPSFTYIGVHQSHHNLATYGTDDDPEYLPFARSRRLILIFSLQSSLAIPILLLIRFLLLAPLGLLWPTFHRWLEAYASSFAMNPAYRRTVAPEMATKMRRWELAMIGVWGTAVWLVARGVMPVGVLVLWYVVLTVISFVNTVRVLGAHAYESDGAPRDRRGQLRDSIDTPGGPWTELWAPVGLRYHALHHYFPGIPYHNLGTAYRRLTAALPGDSEYHVSVSPSLRRSLVTLYGKAKQRAARLAER